jgi:ATP-dependent Clp protease adaptor protein ClpS
MTQTIVAPDVQSQNQNRNQTAPLYNVVLLNDDDHSYDYVIEMLQRLFCFSEQQAYHHALEVDMTQRTVLITCSLDPRIPHCKGSMSAIVEPATTT